MCNRAYTPVIWSIHHGCRWGPSCAVAQVITIRLTPITGTTILTHPPTAITPTILYWGLWLRGAAYGPYAALIGDVLQPKYWDLRSRRDTSTAYGQASRCEAYNPYTGARPRPTRVPCYDHGDIGSQQECNTAYTQHASNAYGSAATGKRRRGVRVQPQYCLWQYCGRENANGDMYAGHDGNVYKNTGSGWQTYNNEAGTTCKSQPQVRPSYDQQHPASSNPKLRVGPAEGAKQPELFG